MNTKTWVRIVTPGWNYDMLFSSPFQAGAWAADARKRYQVDDVQIHVDGISVPPPIVEVLMDDSLLCHIVKSGEVFSLGVYGKYECYHGASCPSLEGAA